MKTFAVRSIGFIGCVAGVTGIMGAAIGALSVGEAMCACVTGLVLMLVAAGINK